MTDVKTRLQEAGRLVNLPDRPFDRLVERRRGSRRRQRITTLAVGLLVAAASLGGVGLLMTPLADGPSAGRAGWEPSRRLALRPGEYFYLRVTSDESVDGWLRDVETWWATDGSGEVRNRSTRQDKYPYPPSGVYEAGGFPRFAVGVAALSTDPEILAGQLEDAPYGWQLLLLETPYASSELRAAVFDVATGLEGVTVVEDARDPAGRPGIALETSERDGTDTATWRMYFDPGTHQALAWTFESTRGGSAWILLESAIVDAHGARPASDQWLVPPVSERSGP
jgi:hypothetical protein